MGTPFVRESKTILDSGFQALDSIPSTGIQFLSLELGLWSPVVTGITDSLSCIPDSASSIFPDSGLHKQKFRGFRNLNGANQYRLTE